MSALPDEARVLVVRLSALGDCLHAVPLVRQLRCQLPGAHVGWAIQEGGLELLREHPDVDRFHLYPRRAGASWPAAMARLRRELRDARYDAVIDVQGLLKSGLVAWLSGAPLRVGFAGVGAREGSAAFLNRRVEAKSRHVVDRNLEILPALGLRVPEVVEWSMPHYPLTGALEGLLEATGDGELVVLNPGTTWPTKHWPIGSFAALAQRLLETEGRPIVLTWGSPSERALCEEIREQAPECRIAPPTTLRELAALLAHARLVVANDTGPLHLAVALGTPTVALFGATDSRRTGPYGPLHRALEHEPRLDCQPCHRKTCSRGDIACLGQLPVERVLGECLEQLRRAG